MISKSSCSSSLSDAAIDKAAKAILSASHLYFTAGAGMGVDSGLPDFRGKNGFWKAYPPMQKLGLEFHQMSNPTWFDKDPTLAHGFFGHRYDLYTTKKPHEGYYILKEFSQLPHIQDYYVFTSNVDGHFPQVFPSNKIVECHGSILHMQCTKPCDEKIYTVEEHNKTCPPEQQYPLHVDPETFKVDTKCLPRCQDCGALARPNILMFGDSHWISSRCDEQEEGLTKFVKAMYKFGSHLVVIEIGAGKGVPTVRMESESKVSRFHASSKNAKGTLIRINPTDSDFPSHFSEECGISIALGGLEALQKIKARMAEIQNSSSQ
ncbi:hypothetical protein C9374_007648 [Naegleria lovaniensis]|uniref:Deacetylase sirtuin-type domain-containing protein n=1 Tax=Naegleria lovaniensis TaxID=51637 RepID=A0AA88GLK7_NAELO|nr:uncharacterized protein C9374_007648 [Naegleria lovaniensis]KAG2379010.1 hypothetical protein C9374_007648 [Naegleria lovaniensis]